MSKSIHTTYRTLSDLKQQDFSSAAEYEKKLREVQQALRRKRRIKKRVTHERHLSPPPPGQLTTAKSVEIEVRDMHDKVHHAATEDDIRAVLLRLPITATDGLTSIRLELGHAVMAENVSRLGGEPDPWLGRLSRESMPGIYIPTILGEYFPHTANISIYAPVYEAGAVPIPSSLCELYLRIEVLQTLVHEVAHHHDTVHRVRRGRWLADRHENVENYAENMEHRWTHEIVLPYLQERYPREVRALQLWVARRGGWKPPLSFFAEDTRRTERNGLTRFRWGTRSALESWIRELPEFKTPLAARLAFAWEIHYADLYPECLQVLDRCLKWHPCDTSLLLCRADTLVHLDKPGEALIIADRLLLADSTLSDAWEIRGNVLVFEKDWPSVLENCQSWRSNVGVGDDNRRSLTLDLAAAHCALGQEEAMNDVIQAYLAHFKVPSTNREKNLRRQILRRAGKNR